MPIEMSQSLGRAQFARLERRAPQLTSLVLVALIAWLLADTTLIALAPSRHETTERADAQDSPHDPKMIAAASALFGTWEDLPAPDAMTQTQAPSETKLPLHLIGVFVSDVRQASGAIIASGQGAGKRYEVGDRIPGNATLESVDVDGVTIRRGARLESLSFPSSTLDAKIVAAQAPNAMTSSQGRPTEETLGRTDPTPSSGSGMDRSSLAEKIEEYRTLASNDPVEALNQLGLKPIEAGKGHGYKVDSLPNNEWVRQSGLQDGDVLLSVNGRRVGNPDLDRLEIDNLFAEGQVRLEIQRGERRFFVSAKFSP